MKRWELFNSRKFLRTERYELSEMTVEYLTQWMQQTQAKAHEQAFRTREQRDGPTNFQRIRCVTYEGPGTRMASGISTITLEAIPKQIITQVYRGERTLYICNFSKNKCTSHISFLRLSTTKTREYTLFCFCIHNVDYLSSFLESKY